MVEGAAQRQDQCGPAVHAAAGHRLGHPEWRTIAPKGRTAQSLAADRRARELASIIEPLVAPPPRRKPAPPGAGSALLAMCTTGTVLRREGRSSTCCCRSRSAFVDASIGRRAGVGGTAGNWPRSRRTPLLPHAFWRPSVQHRVDEFNVCIRRSCWSRSSMNTRKRRFPRRTGNWMVRENVGMRHNCDRHLRRSRNARPPAKLSPSRWLWSREAEARTLRPSSLRAACGAKSRRRYR